MLGTSAMVAGVRGVYAGVKKFNKFYDFAEFEVAKRPSLFKSAKDAEITKILKQNKAGLKSLGTGALVAGSIFGLALLINYLTKEN